jgi:hypothetical protein
LRRRSFHATTALFAGLFLLLAALLLPALPLGAREKDKLPYGEGLIVNVPLPEFEVEQVVTDIVGNGIIRGTKEYNKDEFISGAKIAESSKVFPAWTEGGKVFYKVREQALDPRNFKDSSDVGTLAVRYVVKEQGAKNTVLRIDAVFEEDFRHTVHLSNGSVEGAEYKDILEHLEAVELIKKETAVAAEAQRELRTKKQNNAQSEDPPTAQESAPLANRVELESSSRDSQQPGLVSPGDASVQAQTVPAQSSSEQLPGQSSPQALPPQALPPQALEDRVKDLRRQVERVVKSPGAPLKSAPFHTASTLQTLSTGTEVLILISTPYWYGIETHDGQHGWIMLDQLEQP